MMKNLTSSAILLPKLFYRKAKAITLALVLTCAAISAFAAKSIPISNNRHNAAFASTITSFAPSSGAPGTLVTVTGTGFTSASTLIIGGKPAIVTSFTATQIVGMVMPGAITGKVTVNTGADVNSATNFTVTPTPFPSVQQGAKLIDTAIRRIGYGAMVLTQQGLSVVLSADGNTAVVTGSAGGSSYVGYLVYTRLNNKWSVSTSFDADFDGQNNLALSADGNTVLIGSELGASRPAKLYRRTNNVWGAQETLKDSVGSTVALSADGKTAILGKQTRGGNYGGGGYTPRGITIMKLVGNTWQAQTAPDVPVDSAQFEVYHQTQYDENGEMIPYEPQRYYAYSGSPGNLVTISADGKTAASVSFGLFGRYSYRFSIGYTVIYALTPTGWAVQTKLPQSYSIKLSADGNTFVADGNVYVRTGNSWSLQQQLAVSGGVASLSADGNTVLFTDEHLVAYTRTGATWTQRTVLPENPPAIVDESVTGRTAALSADGTTAFLGVPGDKAVTVNDASGNPFSFAGSVTAYAVIPPVIRPTGVATNITFFPQAPDSIQFSFKNGSGSERAVFIKEGSTGFPTTVDGVAYTANPKFGQGTPAGAGWYCIYNGPHTRTDAIPLMAGLKPSTPYIIAIVEYNGKYGTEKYATAGATGKVTSDDLNIRAKNVAFSNTTGTTTTLSWTNGSGVGRMVFMSTTPFDSGAGPLDVYYSPNTRYGSGNQANGYYCVYNGTGNTVNITGLTSGQRYRAIVYDYNGSVQAPRVIKVYEVTESAANVVTPMAAPTGYATGLTFSGTTASTTTMSWTNGNGTSRAVFIKAGTLGFPAPADGVSYAANANFPVGAQIGTTGWYCVYNGTGSSVNITGLTANTNYHTAVVEYNGTTGSQKYLTSKGGPADVKTLAPPTGPATPPTGYATSLAFSNTTSASTTLNWVSSNGRARAVFLKLGTSGALNVVQATTYTGNSSFGAGSVVGTNGWYCVYNGTGNSVNITGLAATSTYRAIVLEYNGTAGTEGYNLSRYNGANVTTTVAPTMLLTTNQKRLLVEQDLLADDATSGLNVHQGMSPNGDGQNDVFTIDGIGAYPQNTVKIINSNGDIIYIASGYDNYLKAFDGHSANGTLQKAGTYFYSLEYKKGAEVIRKTGYLILKF